VICGLGCEITITDFSYYSTARSRSHSAPNQQAAISGDIPDWLEKEMPRASVGAESQNGNFG
jgi:hypothetical protein